MTFFPSLYLLYGCRSVCQCRVQILPESVYASHHGGCRAYNTIMNWSLKTPYWLRRNHPVVQRYLRQPVHVRFQLILLGLTVSVFLLLGGLSLPVLYCVFSLVILVQITVSTSDKLYHERQSATWDLIRLTPFSARELLLSMWAASLWQLNRTWMMMMYRLLHGAIIIGAMVYNLMFAEIAPSDALPILLSGTLLIVLQPFTEMYFSGMVGLAGANRLRDRANAQGLAITLVLVYWLAYIGTILGLLLVQNMHLTGTQMVSVFLLPVLLPLMLGYFALRMAESAFR